MSEARLGSDDEYCAVYPLDGHHYVAHSVDAAPIRYVDRCQLCGHISSRALRKALAPDGGGFIEVDARSGSLVVRHVGGCFCGRSPGAQVADVKTLDARCIAAYRVPAVRALVDGDAAKPSDGHSGEGTEDRHPETYDEGTLELVHRALSKAGLHRQDAIDAIAGMQNAGILFRERADREERLVTLQEFDD
jgi:hypothetical protein